jgi:hypothetical protein
MSECICGHFPMVSLSRQEEVLSERFRPTIVLRILYRTSDLERIQLRNFDKVYLISSVYFLTHRYETHCKKPSHLMRACKVAVLKLGSRDPFKGHQIFLKGSQSRPGFSYYLRFVVVCNIVGSQFWKYLERVATRNTKKLRTPAVQGKPKYIS